VASQPKIWSRCGEANVLSELYVQVGGLLTDASDGAAKTFISRLQEAVDEHNRTAARDHSICH
jgi:hypothetical protein